MHPIGNVLPPWPLVPMPPDGGWKSLRWCEKSRNPGWAVSVWLLNWQSRVTRSSREPLDGDTAFPLPRSAVHLGSRVKPFTRVAGVSPLSCKTMNVAPSSVLWLRCFSSPFSLSLYAQPSHLWSQCSTANGTWGTLLGNRCCKGQLPLPSHPGGRRPYSAPSCLSQNIQGKSCLVLWRRSVEARNYSESRTWKQTAGGKKRQFKETKEKHDGRQQKATLNKELLDVWEQVENMRNEISKTDVQNRVENFCVSINISKLNLLSLF